MIEAIRPDDLRACQALLRGGSKSFAAAARLLPRRVMEPATALYAFCRLADDAVDNAHGPAPLAALRARLDAIYATAPTGRPLSDPTDRALASVVRTHHMPRGLLDALIEGFAWDAAGRQYEDLDALHAYAARVAGTVGAMMAVLMGVRAPCVLARACDLGIAMQLSNIARDVGEDARAGRLYLPRRWLRDAGVDPDRFLAEPRFSPELGEVVRRLVQLADALYARADAGIAALPLDCRPGIGAARRLYAAIGHRVLQMGGNSVEARAVVPGWRKAALLARATAAAPFPGGPTDDVPLPAARFLVGAVTASPAPRPPPGRLVWVMELFAQLDARQSLASDARSGP